MTIEEALHDLEIWLELDGVEGIAQGESNDEPCITVFVSNSEAGDRLPDTHEGFKIVVEVTGEFNIL